MSDKERKETSDLLEIMVDMQLRAIEHHIEMLMKFDKDAPATEVVKRYLELYPDIFNYVFKRIEEYSTLRDNMTNEMLVLVMEDAKKHFEKDRDDKNEFNRLVDQAMENKKALRDKEVN